MRRPPAQGWDWSSSSPPRPRRGVGQAQEAASVRHFFGENSVQASICQGPLKRTHVLSKVVVGLNHHMPDPTSSKLHNHTASSDSTRATPQAKKESRLKLVGSSGVQGVPGVRVTASSHVRLHCLLSCQATWPKCRATRGELGGSLASSVPLATRVEGHLGGHHGLGALVALAPGGSI